MNRLALAALLFAASAAADTTPAPDCVACRDQLKKALELCKTEPAGASQDVCREAAHRDARQCESTQGASCELDLLLDPPPKPQGAPQKQ